MNQFKELKVGENYITKKGKFVRIEGKNAHLETSIFYGHDGKYYIPNGDIFYDPKELGWPKEEENDPIFDKCCVENSETAMEAIGAIKEGLIKMGREDSVKELDEKTRATVYILKKRNPPDTISEMVSIYGNKEDALHDANTLNKDLNSDYVHFVTEEEVKTGRSPEYEF